MNVQVIPGGKVDVFDIVNRSPVAKVVDACQTLKHFMLTSVPFYVGMVDGEAICVWGLRPPSFLGDTAYLWLICTEAVRKHQFIFVRHSQRCMEEMLEHYPIIIGHCSIDQPQAIRWVKWLGGKFDEPEGQLLPFTIRKRNG